MHMMPAYTLSWPNSAPQKKTPSLQWPGVSDLVEQSHDSANFPLRSMGKREEVGGNARPPSGKVQYESGLRGRTGLLHPAQHVRGRCRQRPARPLPRVGLLAATGAQ